MNVIIAPHPDDEIIGCFEILKTVECIVYDGSTKQARREEALRLPDEIPSIKIQMFNHNIPPMIYNKENTFYFPSHDDIHPLHRRWAYTGEQMARIGFDVIFYTTNMNVLYMREVKEPDEKEALLNKVYSSQKSLWEHEKKYVLFEGYCKWVF